MVRTKPRKIPMTATIHLVTLLVAVSPNLDHVSYSPTAMEEIDSIILFLHDKTSKKHLVEKYNKLRKQLNGDIPRIMEAVSNGVTVEISPVQSQKKIYTKTTKPSGTSPLYSAV